MDGKLIERLDRQRYGAAVWQTASLLSVFIGTLKGYIELGAEPHAYIFSAWFPGIEWIKHLTDKGGTAGIWIGWFVCLLLPLLCLLWGGIKWGRVWCRARRNPELHEALYDECYRQHKYKYQRLALWVAVGLLIVAQIVGLLELWLPIKYPQTIVSEIIMLVVLLTLKISWLIYNRDRT